LNQESERRRKKMKRFLTKHKTTLQQNIKLTIVALCLVIIIPPIVFADEAYQDKISSVLNPPPKNGVYKVYYDNGVLWSEVNLKKRKLEGMRKAYYPNGNLMEEENYKKGHLDGIRKYYSIGGRVLVEENYKEGKLEGARKKYYSSGKLWSEENYKGGSREGEREEYYENGGLKIKEKWGDGKLISRVEHKATQSY
jgi:antitoxin component YwqK of YwqJK toxin-antitoxin module